MKFSLLSGLGTLTLSSVLLAACQTDANEENALNAADSGAENVQAEEMGNEESITEENEVHTNNNESNHDHDEDHEHDHNHNHSDETEHNHDNDTHSHAHHEESQDIYDGYFEDEQIEDRPLSDWEGDWQSVYPFLQDGTLDEVFAHKAEESDEMTAEEYKKYYKTGYETETGRILIEDDSVTFFDGEKEYTGEYLYDGYEILTYEAGNRGVRFIFALNEDSENLPQYIQFSDHIISPAESDHFHLYWGDDRKELLEEVTNWPTYYPASMNGDGIVHEMIAH